MNKCPSAWGWEHIELPGDGKSVQGGWHFHTRKMCRASLARHSDPENYHRAALGQHRATGGVREARAESFSVLPTPGRRN